MKTLLKIAFLFSICSSTSYSQNFVSMQALIDTTTGTWEVSNVINGNVTYNPQQQEYFTFFTPSSAYPNDSTLNICYWDSNQINWLFYLDIDTNIQANNLKLYNIGANSLLYTRQYALLPTDSFFLNKISDAPYAPYIISYDTLQETDTIIIIENINIIDSVTIIDTSYTFDTIKLSYTFFLNDTTVIVDTLNQTDTVVVIDTIYQIDTIFTNSIERNSVVEFKIYPTLNEGHLYCELTGNSTFGKDEKVMCYIFDSSGACIAIRHFNTSNKKVVFDVKSLTPGKYYMQFRTKIKIIESQYFIRK